MLGNHMFLPSLSPFISAFPVSDLPPTPEDDLKTGLHAQGLIWIEKKIIREKEDRQEESKQNAIPGRNLGGGWGCDFSLILLSCSGL